METQLEDFIIYNWKNTELGKRFDLIIEEGELVSQQYRTEIGNMDILAKDKKTGDYVVIELKKNQREITSGAFYSMGVAIPMSVGASVTFSKKQIYINSKSEIQNL